jgi:hypothetical protein
VASLTAPLLQLGIKPREDPAGIALENRVAFGVADVQRVDIALGVVEIVPVVGSIPRTAPTISLPNRIFLFSITSASRLIPG